MGKTDGEVLLNYETKQTRVEKAREVWLVVAPGRSEPPFVSRP